MTKLQVIERSYGLTIGLQVDLSRCSRFLKNGETGLFTLMYYMLVLFTTILKNGRFGYDLLLFMYFKAAEKEFKTWKARLKRTFCSRSSSVVMMPKETRSIFARQCGSNRESQDSETMGQGTDRERRNRGRFLVETPSDIIWSSGD